MGRNVDSRYIKAILFAVVLVVAIMTFSAKILDDKNANNDVEQSLNGNPPSAIQPFDGNLADNYVANAVSASGEYSIWKEMPVRVFVEKNPYANIVKSAFLSYNTNFKGLIEFQFVDNKDFAQLRVSFPDKLEKTDNEKYAAGLTSNVSSGKDIMSSTVKLITKKNGVKLSPEFVYNTALHEIGHALGINGHSDKRDDVMYGEDVSRSMKAFSPRDIATLRIMYSKNEEAIKQSSSSAGAQKLQEAIRYTQQAPDKVVGWVNLGNIYYDLKMLPEALDAYKKALQIDPSDASIYASMGSCYYSSKKYETSAQFYEYAKERAYDPVEIESYEAMIALSNLSGQKYDAAYGLYSSLISKYPNKKEYFINYLYLCTYLKKPEGKSKLQEYLQMHPEDNNDKNIQQYKSYYKIN